MSLSSLLVLISSYESSLPSVCQFEIHLHLTHFFFCQIQKDNHLKLTWTPRSSSTCSYVPLEAEVFTNCSCVSSDCTTLFVEPSSAALASSSSSTLIMLLTVTTTDSVTCYFDSKNLYLGMCSWAKPYTNSWYFKIMSDFSMKRRKTAQMITVVPRRGATFSLGNGRGGGGAKHFHTQCLPPPPHPH